MAEHPYEKFYKNYSLKAPFVFLLDALFSKNKSARISLLNRLHDYLRLVNNNGLFHLHQEINGILFAESRKWQSHDYGEGYFYQSFDAIGISGLRDTEARVKEMNLKKLVSGKTIIDIGCNSGFLALSVAGEADYITGIDINPHLIAIGNKALKYLGHKNVNLRASSFEDFSNNPAGVVFSFANHHTFDGNTKQSVEEYFNKCKNIVKSDGLLVFESHHPQHENKDSLRNICSIIEKHFAIQKRATLKQGTFFDKGRTFIVAKRK